MLHFYPTILGPLICTQKSLIYPKEDVSVTTCFIIQLGKAKQSPTFYGHIPNGRRGQPFKSVTKIKKYQGVLIFKAVLRIRSLFSDPNPDRVSGFENS